MARAATGRQRYQWLLLVVAAALVLLWVFGGGLTGDDSEDSPSSSPSSSSPTHQYTATTTPSTEPTVTPSSDTSGPSGTDPESGLPYVDEASLPAEARDVLDRIDAGGPFKYPDDDGKTFENREELLPDQPMGYYREYTVEIAPDVRGPLRIVTGDEDEYYWTDDHYDSFSRIRR